MPVVAAVATSNVDAAADDGGTYVTPSFALPGGMLDGTSAGEEKNAGVSVMATNWARNPFEESGDDGSGSLQVGVRELQRLYFRHGPPKYSAIYSA